VRRFTLFFGWLVVVGLATTLTWQIVSAADDRVSERPIAPLNVAAPAIADSASTTVTTLRSTTTTSSIPTSPTIPSTGSSAAPATTSASSTTPTVESWSTRSVNTTGGSLTLRYRPGEVTYQSAAPAPGFQVEVEKPGPPVVRVEFESESQKVEVEASWEYDGLDVHVSSDGEDED
jgi:hypothetical protein